MPLTKVSYSLIDGAPINVNDYGAVGDGVTDDTAAIQAAVDYAGPLQKVTFMPAGTYLITDTINFPRYTQIQGEHQNAGFISGTIITFAPTTAKSLFVPVPTGGFIDGYLFDGLYIQGNSTDASGNSIIAFDVDSITNSNFKNLRIQGFRTGIRCYGTINNRFERINLSLQYIQNILYDGNICTTDVWDQCYIINAPIGVQTNGQNITIRFVNSIFETLSTYGVNLTKESSNWIFVNNYSENVPSDNIATNAMFRVGYDGTTTAFSAQLNVIGGYYGGRNAGLVGSFIDVDSTSGVNVGNLSIARFTNGIKTSTNTLTNQVVVNGWTATSIGTMITDATKVSGYYPLGVVNSGSRNAQTAKFATMQSGPITLDGGAAATSAGNLSIGRAVETSVGAAGGASALPATPLGYIVAYLGSTKIKIPYYND